MAVATEPEGAAGLRPALGGFSLGVNAFSSPEEQAASYLFIQWITSEELALPYVEAGGVSGRTSVYENPEVAEAYPYVEPLVSSWQADTAVPFFRPRFPEWPQISEIIADYGTRIMLGDLSVEEGAASLDEQVRAILGEGGYYADRPKIQ